MDKFDGDGAWAWGRPLAHDESVLDAAWAELMQQHWWATEVPLEQRGTVLDVGINSWVRTATSTHPSWRSYSTVDWECAWYAKTSWPTETLSCTAWDLRGASRSPTSSFRSPSRRRPSSSARPCRNSSAGQDKERTAPVATIAAARQNHRARSRRAARETMMGRAQPPTAAACRSMPQRQILGAVGGGFEACRSMPQRAKIFTWRTFFSVPCQTCEPFVAHISQNWLVAQWYITRPQFRGPGFHSRRGQC